MAQRSDTAATNNRLRPGSRCGAAVLPHAEGLAGSGSGEIGCLMQLAVEQSPVSIVITDCAGVIEYVNPKFTELTGYSSFEAVGQTSRILNAGQNPTELYRQLWETIGRGEDWCGEILNRKKNAQLFWEWVRISPIRNPGGAITGYLAVKEDITARKALEKDLRNARDSAENANRLRSEFLANMSHEILTPLHGVLGMAGLLRETPLSPEQGDYLQALGASAQSLLSVLNDILDISRLEVRKLELEAARFPLRSSLEKALEALAADAAEKGLRLSLRVAPEVPDILVGDAGRLMQVLAKLLRNAVKFTEQGEVQLAVASRKIGQAETVLGFSVTDTGIGIAPELQARIFEPFFQADGSTTRRYGGTGLGLAISARLVEMMGGTLEVESRPGQGSSFHFTLPLGGRQGLPGLRSPEEGEGADAGRTALSQGGEAEFFDLVETLARMDGDWELFREVTGMFAVDSRLMLARLEEAIGSGDATGVARAAHTLKGAVSNFGARAPRELALKLEVLGKSGQLGGAGELLGTLQAELERLREALETCTGRLGHENTDSRG